MRGLDRRPLRDDVGCHVPAVATVALGPDDAITHGQLSDRPRSPVGHQDRRIAMKAVNAGVTASAVGVDGPAEGHPRSLGDAVERGFGADLVEARVERLGGVEVAHDRRLAIAGQRSALLGLDREIVPSHERMFADAQDGPVRRRRRWRRAAARRPCPPPGWPRRGGGPGGRSRRCGPPIPGRGRRRGRRGSRSRHRPAAPRARR